MTPAAKAARATIRDLTNLQVKAAELRRLLYGFGIAFEDTSEELSRMEARCNLMARGIEQHLDRLDNERRNGNDEQRRAAEA